ncbi:acyl-coenzyme A oxidase, putative [Candida dubliniensis CD36]|uniref:Acyl-coenzyme A oxidase n=1 Tax=Candida dubliniensis (strain CD36 / ATCC MYA-646 / CBS 7987 / NCPF 3949 / NRRL Y-17841) TaxID=573826 RepID=B9WJ60_CANDC|nr:acyl-coenzyme A oxidase, putative [Candida dubliniensis CD36]CAX41281.1 acyl-coenzyme A oxidase, putative [Candida dubliniensis CD36]
MTTELQKEREQIKFNPKEVNYFLEGSKERSEIVSNIVEQMEKDPVLKVDASYYNLTKEEQREVTAKKIDRISRYFENEFPDQQAQRLSIIGVFDPQVFTRIGVNLGLFVSCIRGNGTNSQFFYWTINKGVDKLRGIYGCFGMTELAHGSNVQGIETTATFDKETDEFVINTPHIGATKWWIGGAAHSATHCTVYARLKVNGKDYGVKTFVVPLRDSNHDLMPGVTVGDIGAKMGRDGIDNGWIQFSNVRIPRFNMLQKYAKVSREGEVTMPPSEQLSYSALIGGRVTMMMDSYRMTSRFITIALRYAITRRQFKSKISGDKETQLIDYPLHQKRLFPFLAAAYLFSQGALYLEQTMNETNERLDDAVAEGDKNEIDKAIVASKKLFVASGCLKSTCTWLTADAIDQARQACGGHGYSSYNGFGKAYSDWVVQCSWEGDNNILAINVAKPMVKEILQEPEQKGLVIANVSDLNDPAKLDKAFEHALSGLARDIGAVAKDKGYDVTGPSLVLVSKLNAHKFLIDGFFKRITPEFGPVLKPLGFLYADWIIETFSSVFLSYGVIAPEVIKKISSEHFPALAKQIRPNVVGLTDAFNLSDMLTNAAIGRADGNVYDHYFETVKSLNPPENTKAPYSQALQDMLNRPSVEERQRGEKSEEAAEILSS